MCVCCFFVCLFTENKEAAEKEKKEKEDIETSDASSGSSKDNKEDNKKPPLSSSTTTNSANDPTASHDDFEESLVKDLSEQQRYNLKHRELYFSKYTDTIAATTIRSKCSVLLFNEEVEKYSDYLTKEVRKCACFFHFAYCVFYIVFILPVHYYLFHCK